VKSPLFEETQTYKPFAYPRAVELTVEHERMHWHEGEIDLSDDVSDWKLGRMTPAEKGFVTTILRMFTQSDLNVGGFYVDHLVPQFRNNEIRNMMLSFATREGTHQRAYALLNDTLGLPDSDYSAFLSIKEMHDKDDFMKGASASNLKGLAMALAKGTFNEGVSLFASFVMLLNFQRRGLMKGMGKVVEWSVKDETKHVEGVTWVFRQLCSEHKRIVTDELKKAVYDMAEECVRLEDAFIDLSFATGGIEGLDPRSVKDYIRYITDRRLTMLGMKELFSIAKNPLPWVDVILNAPDHTNFFENKVAEYEVGSLVGEWTYTDAEIRIYGKEGCPYCSEAKALMAARGISYEYVDLTAEAKRKSFYDNRAFEGAFRSMPKVYRIVDDREVLIGGFKELSEMLHGPAEPVDI
jgi:glutaredoxin 3